MMTNVLEWLEQDAVQRPDAIAIGDVDGEVCFRALCDQARALGTYLSDYVNVGDPVAFYLEKSTGSVAAMFGAVYAGGFYSYIDVRQPAARAARSMGVLLPPVIVTDRENWPHLLEVLDQIEENEETADYEPAIVVLGEVMEAVAGGQITADEECLAAIRAQVTDLAPLYVNFTSGSTGTPKGVAVSHRSVIDFITYFTQIFGITENDVLANQAPFDFDVSVKDLYSGLCAGARVQLIPREFFSNPTVLMDYLCEHGATVLVWAVSAMCFVSIMNALDYRTPGTIRMVLFSGEVMPIKQLNKWRQYLPDVTYVNLYGPTEITCNCTYYILENRDYELTEVIPAGKAFPNEHVFLLDEEDHEIPVTDTVTEGEICVSGTCVALGYYKNPERTAAAFMPNPTNRCYEERMYRTGDLGRYDAAGNFVYASRKDFQIKLMGHRIELGEIETGAMAVDGVTRAVCLYDADKKRLRLYYTGEIEGKDLLAAMRETMAAYMVPNKAIRVDAMPLTKNGKVDRNALGEMK